MPKYKNVEPAKHDISELLKTVSGSKMDICHEVYKKIASYPGNEPELLRFFFEQSEQIESNEECPVEVIFSEEEKKEYINGNYGKMIDEALEILIKKGLKKEQFYEKLWKDIITNALLDSSKLRAFAVYFIWIDMRIPYFELEEGIKMSGDEYRDIRNDILEEIKRARFILSVPVEQKTERASRLVKMLESIEDEKKKAVLMTQILLIHEQTVGLSAFINNGGRIVYDEQTPSD